MITPALLFTILTFAIILLIAIVAVLERKLARKQDETMQTPEYFVTQELNQLKSMKLEPQQMLEKIDSLAKRTIFSNIQSEDAPDYSQLAELSANKPNVAEFCSEMAKTLYAGQSVTLSDAKALLQKLEETLREEGKIVLIAPKREIVEKEKFFLDTWIEKIALVVNTRIQEWKERKAVRTETTEAKSFKEEIKASVIDEKIEVKPKEKEINPIEELKKLKTKITPEKSKPLSKDKKKKEREEYRYIESLDVLDRIQNKIKNRNISKEN